MLSISLPVFNEVATLEQMVNRIRAVAPEHELIIVDDGSTDGTLALLDRLEQLPGVRVYRHAVNKGKGAALRTSFAEVRGDIVIVQDADLEYDPAEFPALIEPIQKGEAEVVYGSRFLPGSDAQISRTTWYANHFITWFFNVVHGQKITDVETCYKAFRRDVLDRIAPTLVENRFGIEIELAARVAKSGAHVVERPIRYRARTREEGKKINWRDGVRALWCILRFR